MLPKHAGQYVCVVGKNLGVSTHHSFYPNVVDKFVVGRWGQERLV